MKIYSFNGKCNAAGNRVKELREQNGISQAQLAARMQVNGIMLNQKAISRIETGERVIADYELAIFASIFHVTTDTLLCNIFFAKRLTSYPFGCMM